MNDDLVFAHTEFKDASTNIDKFIDKANGIPLINGEKINIENIHNFVLYAVIGIVSLCTILLLIVCFLFVFFYVCDIITSLCNTI